MCNFPSWRELPNGKVLFLTDKIIEKWLKRTKHIFLFNRSGHAPISFIYPKSENGAKDKEGFKDCPKAFKKAILAGKCDRMLRDSQKADFSFSDVSGLKLPKYAGCNINLKGCDLSKVRLPIRVDEFLNLTGCNLKGIKLNRITVYGEIDLSDCKLKGKKLPKLEWGRISARRCDLTGVKFDKHIKGYLNLRKCTNLKDAVFPEEITGSLDLSFCDLRGAKLPKKVGFRLILDGSNIDGVELPENHQIIKEC